MDRRHPHHDAVAATLQAWYTSSAPAMGVRVERRPFGVYMRYPPDNGEVTLRDVEPADVSALLADVRTYYGDASVGVYLSGTGRFSFAQAGGDPAAILGLFDGDDRHIFLLATRVPFRHRGIARWLLAHTIAAAYADGCRSVLINCDPADTPIRLYRRLGFTDEVYWRQRYELPSEAN